MSRSGLVCGQPLVGEEALERAVQRGGVVLLVEKALGDADALPYGTVEDIRALVLVEPDELLRRERVGGAEGAGEDAARSRCRRSGRRAPRCACPSARSISASTSAGIRPRIPPPSMLSTRIHAGRYNSGVRPHDTCGHLLRGECSAGRARRAARSSRPRSTPTHASPSFAKGLRCPDIVMDRPWGIYLDTVTKPGRALLRAGNAIESIGKGPGRAARRALQPRLHARAPAHLQARRRLDHGADRGAGCASSSPTCRATGGSSTTRPASSSGRLDPPGSGARARCAPARRSPIACATSRTRPWLSGTPYCAHYPACSNNIGLRRDMLGTSVGWADVYPPDYPEQWIDVTGLRGCFAYVHTADPGTASTSRTSTTTSRR